MIQLLLNILPLRFSKGLPSLSYGNFWNEYIHMGSTRAHGFWTRLRSCGDQSRSHRIRHTTRRNRRCSRFTVPRALPLGFIGLSLITSTISLHAQVTKSVTEGSRPLWEGGIAFVGARVPAYPGANQYNFFALPFPSFFYRGDIVRADEEGGMRGRFFKNDTFEINLSIGGSLPANSDENEARQGMPDLKTMGELGPGLLATLWEQRGKSSFKLGLNIPLRTALTLDFWSIKERGLVFNPLIYFITENFVAKKIFTFTGLSSVVASQKFHKVFYQVDQQYVTNDRAAYQAKSGYLSTTLSQGFSTQLYKNVMTFLGVSYSHYKGAANYNSPLMKQDHNFNVAMGLVWWFYESDSKESYQKMNRNIKEKLTQNNLF